MADNFGQQIGSCLCPNCGFQFALRPAWGAWQGGMMPAGQMAGTIPGTAAGTTYGPGPAYSAGTYAPGWDGPTYGAGGVASDEEIREMVYNAIDADPSIPGNLDIEVDVTGGIVALTGSIPSKRIKHAVGDAAWWIADVVDVNNQLRVTPRRERRRERAEMTQAQQPTG